MRYDRAGDQHYDVIRVHQVDPRPRPGRGAALPGPDAGGGGGSAVRRPAAHGPRERGRRARRPDGAAGRGRGGPGRAAGRPSGGPVALAQVTVHLATAPKSNAVITAIDAAMSDVRPAPPARCRRICATGTTPVPRSRATRSATATPTTRGRGAGPAVPARRAGGPRLLPADDPRRPSGCWPNGCPSCAASCAGSAPDFGAMTHFSGCRPRLAPKCGPGRRPARYRGSRSIGQLMHRGPPRPRPSSPPGSPAPRCRSRAGGCWSPRCARR